MGDKFSSGGSDQQVAKDQATLLNKQEEKVGQKVEGSDNVFSKSGNVNVIKHANNVNIYYGNGVPPPGKDLVSIPESEDFVHLNICRENHPFFKGNLKVTWQFIGTCDRKISYNLDEKKMESYSLKVTEALYDFLIMPKKNKGYKIRLKKLAEKGHELFNYLVPNDCEIKNDITKLSNISLLIDSHVDIPWNSLYIDSDLENNIELCHFIGNRCKISIISAGSEDISCRSSRYASRDHNGLKEIKDIVVKKFKNTIHLVDRKTKGFEDNKLKILECKSLKDFCNQIRGDGQDGDFSHPDLLFICFDKYHRTSVFSRKSIYIGNLKLSISGLKNELEEIQDYPPFVIIIGKEANFDAYIELKKLFIHELKWSGIFIDGNIDLKLSCKYLLDFFKKFTDGDNSVPDVLFELRKENPIGLAFTAYCNDNVCFKKYS